MKSKLPTFALFAMVCAISLSSQTVNAQKDQRDLRLAKAPQGEQRIALVIGNGAYRDSPLSNPVNDAKDMAKALRAFGFEVIYGENLSQNDMKRNIRAFGDKIRNGGVGLFYYAGHGIQINGANYLVPVRAVITKAEEVEYESVDVGLVLAQMENAHNRLNLVILDACRNNPFARSFRSTKNGLASIDAPSGTMIAYATAPGSVASDGGAGRNGLYTQELLRFMGTPDLNIEQVFKQVRIAVQSKTQNKQVPWESSSLVGDFFFLRGQPALTLAKAVPLLLREFEFESVTVDSRGTVKKKGKGQARVFTENIRGETLQMVEIRGGTFLMGSQGYRVEIPQHKVTVQPFYMGMFEVTQLQWRAVASLPKVSRDLNPDPSGFKGDTLPVESVSWEDAVEFCARLSKATGREYRLPSEAEWEYACRAGTKTDFAFGETITTDLVNYNGNNPYGSAPKGTYREKTTPVGQMAVANAFGLYDMHCNVYEWVLDPWHDTYSNSPTDGSVWEKAGKPGLRVVRGGAWISKGQVCRSSNRYSTAPDLKNYYTGFRLVLVAPTR